MDDEYMYMHEYYYLEKLRLFLMLLKIVLIPYDEKLLRQFNCIVLYKLRSSVQIWRIYLRILFNGNSKTKFQSQLAASSRPPFE